MGRPVPAALTCCCHSPAPPQAGAGPLLQLSLLLHGCCHLGLVRAQGPEASSLQLLWPLRFPQPVEGWLECWA